MLFRFLIRILANNQQLIQKLSESYVMRKAAQVVVRAMFSGKQFIEQNRLHEKLTPEQFKALMRDVASNFQNQIKQAEDILKKKMK